MNEEGLFCIFSLNGIFILFSLAVFSLFAFSLMFLLWATATSTREREGKKTEEKPRRRKTH